MYGAALVDPGGDLLAASRNVLPGSAIIAFGNDLVGIVGRLLGLELRDTFLVLVPGPSALPAFFFRKPLSEPTVSDQLTKTRTGAVNIDACRVRPSLGDDYGRSATNARGTINAHDGFQGKAFNIRERDGDYAHAAGRWPPNILIVHGEGCGVECEPSCPARALDLLSGELRSGMMIAGQQRQKTKGGGGYHGDFPDQATSHDTYGDSGGASRFFPQFSDGGAMFDWLRKLITPPGLPLLEET